MVFPFDQYALGLHFGCRLSLTFDDEAEDYFSRQQVLERLHGVHLPANVTPLLGPLTTGIGEIYRYLIEAPKLPLVEQRAIQDWTIEPLLRSVPGVADVVGFGGGIKQYQIQIIPTNSKLQIDARRGISSCRR